MKRRSSSCLLTHDARKRFILPLFVLALVAFIFIHIFVYVCNCHWDCGAVSVAHISSSDHNVEKNSLSFMRSKRALLVSHELSLSGGPLLLIELAFFLRNVGTQVIWITCQKPAKENKISHSLEHKMTSRGVQVLSARGQEAVDVALRVDIIVLNTVVTGKWLDVALNKHLTQVFPKILWWIHEMRGHYFKLDYVKHLPFVKVAMIDSNTTAEYWKNRTHERLGIQMPKTYVVHLGNSNEFMEIAEDYITRRILKEHIRESLGIGAEDLVFAIINSVSRGKGQDLFLQSFYESLQLMQENKAKVPAIYAIVVGSDMDAQTKFEGELRNFVASKGIQGRVHFVNKTHCCPLFGCNRCAGSKFSGPRRMLWEDNYRSYGISIASSWYCCRWHC